MDKRIKAYVSRLRNKAKRVYAVRYWDWLNGYESQEPTYDLTYMGAQAVRMSLWAIYRETHK